MASADMLNADVASFCPFSHNRSRDLGVGIITNSTPPWSLYQYTIITPKTVF